MNPPEVLNETVGRINAQFTRLAEVGKTILIVLLSHEQQAAIIIGLG